MAKRAKKERLYPVAPPSPAPAGAGAVVAAAAPRRGLEAFQGGRYSEAIEVWKQVRRAGGPAGLDRALAEAHFRRALVAANPSHRAQELQEAVALAPEQAIYQLHLGLAHHRQGQLRRALQAYETAHRLIPADDRARRHLALALLGDPVDLRRAGELLAEAPASDEPAARLRALAALRQAEAVEAVAILTTLRRSSPLGVLALGLAHLGAGQPEAAAETLARVQRSRGPLSAEARQAAAIAAVVALTRTGDLDGALKALLALELPDDTTLRRALAAAARPLAQELLLEERTEEALLAWQQARAAAPGHEPTRRVLAHLHEVLGTRAARRDDFRAAAQHWEAALVDQPGDARLLKNLALAEERLERWPRASAHWEQLTQRWKKDLRSAGGGPPGAELRRQVAVAYRHLAATYEAAEDAQAATRTLERALILDPSQGDLRLRAAELYLENEEYGRAIDHLRRLLPERPNDTRVLMDLGSAYDLKGDDRQAQIYLEQALALEPDNPAAKATLASVHHGRGDRWSGSGQAERALAEYQRAIELEPNAAEHYERLGAAYLRLGQRSPGRAALDRAVALDPKHPPTLARIGGVYLESGDEKEADKLFRQALRLGPGPVGQLTIGMLCVRLGKLAKAHQYFAPLLKLSDPLLPALVGKLLVEAEHGEDAVRYLERAVSLDPLNVRTRLDLAWALTFGRRDYPRAQVELDEAEREARRTDARGLLAEIAEARETLGMLIDSAAGRSRLRDGWW